MITVSMPLWIWVACAISIILGGKESQQGGISWARGNPWMLQTFVSVMMLLLPILTILIFAARSGGDA